MAQKLCLPFRRPVLSAGYLHTGYEVSYGYPHYGWDMGCDEPGYKILSPGSGRVISAGLDGKTTRDHLGYCLVLVYEAAALHDGSVRDVACHMFHLESMPRVRAGDRVRRGAWLGDYGGTGGNLRGRHLHLEFTLDADRPRNAKGIASGGNVMVRDPSAQTISPENVCWFEPGQSIRGCTPYWFTQDELRLIGGMDKEDENPPVNLPVIEPDMLVTIKPGAVWGGLTTTRGKPVPTYFTGAQTFYTTAVATHNGVREALIGTLMSWVAVDSLEAVK